MHRPTLYSFRRCPYAIRARLAIKASGTQVNLREVALRHKPAAMIALSAKATVPVLGLPDGSVLEQSLDIMHWALQSNDPHDWLRPGENSESQGLIELNDGAFKQSLDRYKYAPRYPDRPAQAYRDDAVGLMLAPLNARLADRQFILRDTPSFADMAIVPFVRQFAAVDATWFDHAPLAHLRRWMRHITGSPLFDSVMIKIDPWNHGDPDILF